MRDHREGSREAEHSKGSQEAIAAGDCAEEWLAGEYTVARGVSVERAVLGNRVCFW